MEIIAHRGNVDKRYVENSLEAILYSLSLDYIDGVELDVRLTKDKKVVICHNSFFNPIDGRIMFIRNHSYRYLKKYKIGSKNNFTHLVTLKEVLKRVSTHKKIFIELKEEREDYKTLVHQVYRIIRKFPHLDLYVCSFRYDLISYFKEKYPTVLTGLIIGYTINTKRMYNHFDFNLVHYRLVDKIQKNAYNLFWTVNSKNVFRSLKEKCENLSIITDKPSIFK